MNDFQHVNISLEILCVAICVILLACVATADYRKQKLNKFFISLISVTIPLLLIDIVVFSLEGSGGYGALFRTAYFLSFFLGAVLLILFTKYLLTFIRLKTAVSRRAVLVSDAAVAVCVVNIIFVVMTQFSGMYYSIDDNNVVTYGSFYLLSQASAIICILLNTGIMLTYRKHYDKREMVFLLSYSLVPVIAVLIQNVFDENVAAIDVATTLTILIFYAGIQSELSKRLKENELELTEVRISTMLSQIQPHFLYNSLMAIQELCHIDPETASQAVGEFSTYLRGNLDSLSITRTIPFDKELSHVDNYLSIEKKRFADKLIVVYGITARDFMLPALSLQFLVENAVRHGVTKREEGGTVTITTAQTETTYIITVADDGVGFNSTPQDGRSHVGTDNVRNRLRSMSGGELTIESEEGVGTTAVIVIPKGDSLK